MWNLGFHLILREIIACRTNIKYKEKNKTIKMNFSQDTYPKQFWKRTEFVVYNKSSIFWVIKKQQLPSIKCCKMSLAFSLTSKIAQNNFIKITSSGYRWIPKFSFIFPLHPLVMLIFISFISLFNHFPLCFRFLFILCLIYCLKAVHHLRSIWEWNGRCRRHYNKQLSKRIAHFKHNYTRYGHFILYSFGKINNAQLPGALVISS